eukprot:gene6987-34257_t
MSDEKPSFTNVFAAPGIMECRDHSMNFYKGGPNTVLRSEFPPLPVVKKSGSMSYTLPTTAVATRRFIASILYGKRWHPHSIRCGSTQGNKKMEKLGYTSQVGNVVFGQGAPASIAIGSTKKISGRTEMNSSYTGGSSTKRNYMWQKDTADGFRSFSTKKKGKVIRTGMTHPKKNAAAAAVAKATAPPVGRGRKGCGAAAK